jgi:hypothetical protein
LSNVNVHFLPPNTTAHLQPLDAGIIRAFKAHYKKQLATHVVEQFDVHRTVNFKIDLACTFRFIKTAWSRVTAESIANCWRKTGIIATAIAEVQEPANDPVAALSETLEKLRVVIPNIMTAEEYLAVDEHVEMPPMLTDEELVAIATRDDAAMSDARSSEGGLEVLQGPAAPPPITGAKARTFVDGLLTYVEENPGILGDAEKHYESFLAVCDEIQKVAARNAPQRRITDYFSMSP